MTLTRSLSLVALAAVLWTLVSVEWASAQSEDAPTVAAENIAFTPNELTIAPGTTVTWVNNDPYQHTVTADDGSFDSGLFDQGQTYSQTFEAPGTYAYHCIPHGSPGGGGMAGLIIVQDLGESH